MAISSKLLTRLAGLRCCAMATLFAVALFAVGLFAPPCPQASPATFDGRAVYDAAFEALRDYHYTLVDSAARADFVAAWQHKHDYDSLLSTEKGTDKVVEEMMWSLGQRFDYYFPPADTKAEQEAEDATIGGIGIAIDEGGFVKALKALGPLPTNAQVESLDNISDDNPLVVIATPDDNTPAGLAHISKGDRIVAVNTNSVNGKTLEQVVKTIRGPVGTDVTLTIAHKEDSGIVATRDVVITRANIITHVVKVDRHGTVYHIRLSNFMSQFGSKEMRDALEEAVQANASGIVLDLRGNGGGRLNQAIEIAKMFINHGTILKMVERDGNHMTTDTTSGTTDQSGISAIVPETTPVIILIDEKSASASEILAGALQVSGRARVIGQPSYGKGVGQVVIPLPLQRSMHVTNFEFFPAGVKMDWVGIVPDIEVNQPANTDLSDDSSNDVQLEAAILELHNAAMGTPTPGRSQAEVDARRAELEQLHRANFAKEVLKRQLEQTSDH
jgi:carboxyl-terminal processing protease